MEKHCWVSQEVKPKGQLNIVCLHVCLFFDLVKTVILMSFEGRDFHKFNVQLFGEEN